MLSFLVEEICTFVRICMAAEDLFIINYTLHYAQTTVCVILYCLTFVCGLGVILRKCNEEMRDNLLWSYYILFFRYSSPVLQNVRER